MQLTMEDYKLMWTAFYFPGHDVDMFGYPDYRVLSSGRVEFSAMEAEIRTGPYHPPRVRPL